MSSKQPLSFDDVKVGMICHLRGKEGAVVGKGDDISTIHNSNAVQLSFNGNAPDRKLVESAINQMIRQKKIWFDFRWNLARGGEELH